jgi:hypothetical protein
MRSKLGGSVKTFIKTDDPEIFGLYPKAGSDIIGIDWKKAPAIVHRYEEIVQTKYDMYN